MGEDWDKFWGSGVVFTSIINFGRKYYFSYIPIHHLGDIEDKLVLEAGCGTSETLCKIAKKAKKVVGVDISRHAVNISKKNFALNKIPKEKYRLMQGDIQKMPYFKDNTFDITFNTGVVEHFDDDRINNKPVEEMIRVTKKHGSIVFLVPCTYSPYYIYYLFSRIPGLNKIYPWEDHRFYTLDMLEKQLKAMNRKQKIKYKIKLCWTSVLTYLVAEMEKL